MPTILVIEDDSTIRSIVAEMLTYCNFEVLEAEDGHSGLQLAYTRPPDLILCDVMMPHLDGYGVLAALRQNLKTAAIPFIFLTAKSDRLDVRKGMQLGADDYLTKPFNLDDLLATIKTRLERQATFMSACSNRINTQQSNRSFKEQHLYQALKNSELVLHYQPQVNLQTGQIVGAEALVRWHSAELGIVSPAEFIPLAEETGLIIPIGEWVLQTACAQAKRWQQTGLPPLTIAVNLSSVQLNQADLTNRVLQILAQTGLAACHLSLELTESLLVQNVDSTIDILNQLRAIQVKAAIDDFGTGYASLGYLQHFPFHTLKIDRCFVDSVDHNLKSAAIVNAIIQMAHQLQLEVVAEGVETEPERVFLHQNQCDIMQGYLFSRPLPAANFEALLAACCP